MKTLEIIGKVLFSYMFVASGIGHLKAIEAMTGYAQYKKLPFAKLGVILSGIVLIIAPVLFVFGIAEVPALYALAAFLLTTAVVFHDFWKQTDPTAKMNETIAFNKNLSLAGAALIIISLI